jgi:methionine-rich copper-binding protein CopC
MQTHIKLGGAICALILTSTSVAIARPMHVLNSTPSAEAIMSGNNAQYVVRFDGPVDHRNARLDILRDGQMVERLHPLLDSAPDVLFAQAPELQPGRYTLHWSVISMPDQETSDGMIAFSVAR